jgi:hypothetical protein
LEKTTNTILINTVEQIPTIKYIKTIPRGHILKLIFNSNIVQRERVEFGENLDKELVDFRVAIHTTEPKIHIEKLIGDKEIEENQDFFEQCAKDYRELGGKLFFILIEQLGISINNNYPFETFVQLQIRNGEVGNWQYFVHGIHCGFRNKKTKQSIEVPLVFGLEFGDLDPYFFSKFIKSTPVYYPLPIKIIDDYADGKRIIDKMVSLGKFERIESNIGNHYGIVVVDRQKVPIKSHIELTKIYEEQNPKLESQEQNHQSENQKFNFWKWIGLKK